MRPLGSHLGPVLYQLPPDWKLDRGRLEHFLQVLPKRIRHVLEFRDSSWYDDNVLEILERSGVSLCLHDMPGSATGQQRVGPIVYVRYHGTSGQYRGEYSQERLEGWVGPHGSEPHARLERTFTRISITTSAATRRGTRSRCGG
jgi:uncharacterized protein YecE (DUF72 family)